jgi:hypothetical protein
MCVIQIYKAGTRVTFRVRTLTQDEVWNGVVKENIIPPYNYMSDTCKVVLEDIRTSNMCRAVESYDALITLPYEDVLGEYIERG